MSNYIQIFILIPFIGFLLSLMVPGNREKSLSRIGFYTAGANLLAFTVFLVSWIFMGMPTLDFSGIVIYQTKHYEFSLNFYFDKISAVYSLAGSLLTFLITIYSRYYMHREDGYKRFFNAILMFYFGYNIAIFSGNFETLFIGWEILGISSFLLIAFYRERYLPVRNAVKVFSIYRIGDIGFLLAMWASHLLWHENITFLKLHDYSLVHEKLQSQSLIGIFISMMILVAAAAKSAQLPFSSWLPRAMEGPTPSSAIFYGSLSVHFGVFLLLRTFPFWEQQIVARIVFGLLGLSTSIVATLIARVQSSIKAQVAYASIAQIGLIFIEISLGWIDLALLHFIGNAFLRTYQLLVSPSVVSYLIREQFYHFESRPQSLEHSFPKKIEYTTYLLSLKEWNLDNFMSRYIFRPLKKLGHRLDFLNMRNVLYFVIPIYLIGLIFLFNQQRIPSYIRSYMPEILAFIGLVMVLKSFTERRSPYLSMLLIILNHFWISLASSFNEKYQAVDNILYLSGVVVFGAIGFICLRKLQKAEPDYFNLNMYHGHIYEHRKLSFISLIACIGIIGFPISPTFIGEDLIFNHMHGNQFFLALFISLSYVMDGIAIIRLYARLFLGPHIKTDHETPYTSS